MLKICSTCHLEYDISFFPKVKINKDGRAYSCKKCKAKVDKEYNERNKDKIKETRHKNYLKNKQKIIKKCEEWKQKNLLKVKLYKKQHYLDNLEHNKELRRKWREKNKAKKRSSHALRRAIKKSATPFWLTKEHYTQIDDIFKKAKEIEELSNIKYSVDHIIPLQNKLVCGLHVPWNLQIITSSENSSKRNKFDGTYDNESWRELFSS